MKILKLSHLFVLSLLMLFVSCAKLDNPDDLPNEMGAKIDPADLKEKVEDLQTGDDYFDKPSDVDRDRRVDYIIPEEEKFVKIEIEDYLPSDPITIDFDEINLGTVIRTFGSLIDRNMIVDPSVDETTEISISLRNEPWDIAFNSILRMNNLAIDVIPETGTLMLYSQARFDELNQDTAAPKYNTAYYSVYYNVAADMQDVVTKFLTQEEQDELVIFDSDDVSQYLVASGPDDILDKIEDVLEQVDVKLQQVYFEIFIVTATDNFQEQMGSRLGLYSAGDLVTNNGANPVTYNASGIVGSAATSAADLTLGSTGGSIFNGALASPTSGIGLIADVGANRFKAELQFLEQDNISTTISSPKLLVANGKTGAIRQTTEYTVTVAAVGEGDPTIIEGEFGLDFSITPIIGRDGTIKITYELENSSADTSGVASGQVPIETVTAIDETEMFIQNEQILVLGGVYTTNNNRAQSRVPGLGSLPVLNWFFSNNTEQDNQQELLIFIIPTIV